MLDWSLLAGPLPLALLALGVAAGVLLLWPRGRPRRWWALAVPIAVVAGLVGTAGTGLVLFEVLHERIPLTVLAWIMAPLVAVGLAVAACLARARWWPVSLAAVLVLLAGASGVNVYYEQFPTVRTALGLSPAGQAAFADVAPQAEKVIRGRAGAPLETLWTPPADMPAAGSVSEVQIPSPASGFPARSGWVYLPPAYLTGVRAELPVLVLLSGQPGNPGDWLTGGQLTARMDRYAAAHKGLAPVVVIPDDLGAEFANPLCLDSRLGKAATYLTVDVPAWIRKNLQVDPDPADWAIAGLSHGGTCALQMAVTAPQVYPTFVDIAGQLEPMLGSRADTVAAAFGTGPEAAAAFRAVNPIDVLKTRRLPQSAGVLVAGAADGEYLPQAKTVLTALQGAGVSATLTVLPGVHTWAVWGPGLESALPWLGTRLNLTR
ncbi:alpha/beta hydrolase [Pseudonocardia sp. GCM10023141]|uniref:alpha/beta hydrolase n=1 Tax=Pseudonocardia sp. GCM10023141 TaxID=3252653 RepID=UPI003619CD86